MSNPIHFYSGRGCPRKIRGAPVLADRPLQLIREIVNAALMALSGGFESLTVWPRRVGSCALSLERFVAMPIGAQLWQECLENNEIFFEKIVNEITGWLDSFAAKRTIDLLDYQERSDVKGSLCEIGLYWGKYFSILVRSAARSGSPVLGLDNFEYVPQPQFHANFDEKFDPSSLAAIIADKFNESLRLTFLALPSSDCGPEDLMRELGQRARFISIDGSHQYDDVLWDLRVAEEVLGPAGVIAADDYLNPVSLGVTAAIDRFLSMTPHLVPFAYVTNKLFLSRPGWADRYRSELERAILADGSDPKSISFKRHFDAGDRGRRNIEASYAGYRILTVGRR